MRPPTSARHTRSGYTLVELVTVVLLLAVGASLLAPGARRLGDRASVLAAREEVVGALARGRAAAVAAGGASVTILTTPPSVRVAAGGEVVRTVLLGGGDRSLEVRLTGRRDSLSFRFDRLGIGRFANGSVTLRRGRVSGGVIVSSYGRVRRR